MGREKGERHDRIAEDAHLSNIGYPSSFPSIGLGGCNDCVFSEFWVREQTAVMGELEICPKTPMNERTNANGDTSRLPDMWKDSISSLLSINRSVGRARKDKSTSNGKLALTSFDTSGIDNCRVVSLHWLSDIMTIT